MVHQFLDVRPEDRRNTLASFVALFAMMLAHAILETARDALFLSRLPASDLPLAYLAIAALAVLLAAANRHCADALPRRTLLTATLAGAALTTALLWLFVGTDSSASLFVFYIWTGLVATMVVVQFWLLLSDVFTVAQAKRVYAVIGAGGLLGATVGSAVAGGLLEQLLPRDLLLVGAAVFGLSALAPAAIRGFANQDGARRHGAASPTRGGLAMLRTQPYLRRLAALVALSALVVTGADFLFKSVVAAEIEPGELGRFFAGFYAALNGLALVVQLLFASWLLRAGGVTRTLTLMPGLLLIGLAAFVLAPGLIPVLVLKAADGSLRHSVNRTASELLYVPLSGQVRHRFKATIDALGQRGGQALASLAILAAIALGAGRLELALGVAVLTVAWIAVVFALKAPYVELFREQLRGGGIDARFHLPVLDLHQLEALMGALNSNEDSQVIAALDVLAEHAKANLIPALILYHPSPVVVLRALELMTQARRQDFLPISERLLSSSNDDIRVAALRARAAVGPNERELRRLLDDSSDRVKATALVGLISSGLTSADESESALHAIIDDGTLGARRALAGAIRHTRDRQLDWVLMELARQRDVELLVEVAEAIAARPHLKFMTALLGMLGVRRVRPAARRAILAIGPASLDFLDGALSDHELSPATRRHIPRTISKLATGRAAEVLLSHLPAEPDGMTRFKILRGLGRMQTDDPRMSLDRAVLRQVALVTLRRIITVLSWQVALQDGAADEPARTTCGSELLLSLLREKQANATERLFRLLDLLRPAEDFRAIFHGLSSTDAKTRASSRELLEHLVEPEQRDPLLALLDDIPDRDRLARVAAFHAPPRLSYHDLLRAMLADGSEAVRCIAAYHIGELGIGELRGVLESARPARETNLRDVIESALSLLGRRPTEVPHAG